MAPLLEAKQQKKRIGMSEGTKQQNVCSAGVSLSRTNWAEGGEKSQQKVPQHTWSEVDFLPKGFLEY